jgi:hypothetical protein
VDEPEKEGTDAIEAGEDAARPQHSSRLRQQPAQAANWLVVSPALLDNTNAAGLKSNIAATLYLKLGGPNHGK